MADAFQLSHQYSRDFRKFWIGQTISTLGSSCTGFALPLLIFQLTRSPLNLALTVVMSAMPYLLFGLLLGAWADRVKRKYAMIAIDIMRALLVAAIPLLFMLGLLSVGWIYAVAFLCSTLSIGFDAANFAAVPSLVKREDLVIANGRLQASYSAAGIAGPLLAGLLLAVMPLSMILLIDAASFLISAASLAWIGKSFNPETKGEKVSTRIHNEVFEGLNYILKQPILRWILLLLLFINFIVPTPLAQIVLFAKQWLAASDSQIGLLLAAGGLGTVIFSLAAEQLRKLLPFAVVTLGSIMLEGLMLAGMALTHQYWIAVLLWAMSRGSSVLFNVSTYSLTQTIVANALLGRVISFIRVLTWSTASLGALLGGLIIEYTNVALIYAVIGLLTFFIALVFFLTPLGHTEHFLPVEQLMTGGAQEENV